MLCCASCLSKTYEYIELLVIKVRSQRQSSKTLWSGIPKFWVSPKSANWGEDSKHCLQYARNNTFRAAMQHCADATVRSTSSSPVLRHSKAALKLGFRDGWIARTGATEVVLIYYKCSLYALYIPVYILALPRTASPPQQFGQYWHQCRRTANDNCCGIVF